MKHLILALTLVFGSLSAQAAYRPSRTEWLRVAPDCSSTPCTIAAKSSGWVTATGVAWNATGRYTVTIVAGYFSSAPACFFMPSKSGAASHRVIVYPLPTTTSWSVGCQDSADAAVNCGFQIMCVGPR
jgi:hypothetical protein